jgi:hypothetical protein
MDACFIGRHVPSACEMYRLHGPHISCHDVFQSFISYWHAYTAARAALEES